MERVKRYTVVLSDGTRLENLRLNGNNYISDTELSADDFVGKLDRVDIESSDGHETMTDCELIQVEHYADGWYFVIAEMSPAEKQAKMVSEMLEDLQSQTDYLAMMTGVDL